MTEETKTGPSLGGAEDETPREKQWEALPADVLEHHLAERLAAADVGSARAVCRRWAESIAAGRGALRPARLPAARDCRCWSPFTSMSTLDLSRCSSAFTGDDLVALRNCTTLTSVNLSGCWKVTDGTAEVLCGFPQLSSLTLAGCELLTDVAIKRLEQLQRLTILDASGCRNITNDALRVLATRPLKHLSLNWCRNITDAGLQHLAILTSLRSLSLDEVKQVRDGGVQALAGLTRLETLSLRWCRNITDGGIAPLTSLSNSLTTLHVDGCLCISDAAFAAISHLTNLVTLHAASTAVTDGGLYQLRNLPKLTHLSVANCSGVTHLALTLLPNGLETLNLARCGGVDATTGDELLALPPRLTSLNLLYCRPTMNAAIAALRDAAPNLQILSGPCDA